jgi:hypothetical protein
MSERCGLGGRKNMYRKLAVDTDAASVEVEEGTAGTGRAFTGEAISFGTRNC